MITRARSRLAHTSSAHVPEEAKLRAAFSVFDTDHSGTLSAAELRAVLAKPGPGGRPPFTDEQIEALIAEFSEDGNGELRYGEFCRIWSAASDPTTSSDPANSDPTTSSDPPDSAAGTAGADSFEQPAAAAADRPASSPPPEDLEGVRASASRTTPAASSSSSSSSSSSLLSAPFSEKEQPSRAPAFEEANAPHKDVGSASVPTSHHTKDTSFSLSKAARRRARASREAILSGVSAVGRALTPAPKVDEFVDLQSESTLCRLAAEQEAKAEALRDRAGDYASDDLPFETRLGLAMINHPKALASLEATGQQRLTFEEFATILSKTFVDGKGVGGGSTNGKGSVLSKVEFRQAVRSPDLGLAAKNSEIDLLFKKFDDDNSGTIELFQLKPFVQTLQDTALAASTLQASELARAEACDAKAQRLHAAARTMRAIGAEEEKNAQIIFKHPIEVRIGLAVRRSRKRLDELIKQWPNAKFGYASRQSAEEGLKQLAVKVNSKAELDAWFDRCFENGLASSICRPANPDEGLEALISLKVELPPLINLAKLEHAHSLERAEAVKASKREALAEQEAIRASDRATARQWALEGAAALKAEAEKVAAVEMALRAKREAALQRRELERQRKEERQRAAIDRKTEDGGGGAPLEALPTKISSTGPRVYNVQLKSTDIGLRKRAAGSPSASREPTPLGRRSRGAAPIAAPSDSPTQLFNSLGPRRQQDDNEAKEVEELRSLIAKGPPSMRASTR